VCDDGNKNDHFGCKADCTGQLDGWNCTPGNQYNPSVCTEICKDGLVVGKETCDDGNTTNAIGWACNSTCNGYYTGWNCTNPVLNGTTECKTICGDGYKAGLEECDDGQND